VISASPRPSWGAVRSAPQPFLPDGLLGCWVIVVSCNLLLSHVSRCRPQLMSWGDIWRQTASRGAKMKWNTVNNKTPPSGTCGKVRSRFFLLCNLHVACGVQPDSHKCDRRPPTMVVNDRRAHAPHSLRLHSCGNQRRLPLNLSNDRNRGWTTVCQPLKYWATSAAKPRRTALQHQFACACHAERVAPPDQRWGKCTVGLPWDTKRTWKTQARLAITDCAQLLLLGWIRERR